MLDRDFQKKLLFLFVFGIFIMILFNFLFPEQGKKLFTYSLIIQYQIKKLFQPLFSSNNDILQEKYFNLLQELTLLKTRLQKELPLKSVSDNQFSYHKLEVEVLKDAPFGYLYIKPYDSAKEGDIVVDRNLVLVGRVQRVENDYVVVEKITKPGLLFNLIDIEDNFIGIGETLANGFIQVETPYLKEPSNLYVFTGGNDGLFPKNLLVGEIIKQNQNSLIIRSLADVYFSVYILKP